jgi:hypothetical protein
MTEPKIEVEVPLQVREFAKKVLAKRRKRSRHLWIQPANRLT